MKKVNIQFKFSNRFLYTFIVTVIMILVGVMVFAYTGNVGHTSSQIDESDPTVTSSVKDGVSWSELSGIPSGFADGTDNEGISGVSWDEITGKPVEVSPVITTYEGDGCGECPFGSLSLHEADYEYPITLRVCKGDSTGVVICNRPNCWSDGSGYWPWRMICLDYS